MSELVDELIKVKQRIEKYGAKGINEQNTKTTLIQPVLRALGWDVEDFEDVQCEYKRRKQDKPVDYALLLLRTPCLFVEAKALGQDLDDRKWANQIMGYAGVAGVRWVALTDGNEYRLYNSHAAVPVEEKLFRTVRISDSPDSAEETLSLLSRDRMQGNEIDSLWNAFFVDRQVKEVVEGIFADDGDASLLRLLSKRLPNLSTKDIKASLRRSEVEVSFPVSPSDLEKSASGRDSNRRRAAKSQKSTRRKAKRAGSPELMDIGVRRREQVALLIDKGYLKVGQVLTAKYRGKQVSATITADGKVRFEGAEYLSVSAAGAAAKNHVGGEGFLSTDGWVFWQTELPDGSRGPLKTIRRAYIATLQG